MSNVVPFESGKVPAHINKFAGLFGGGNQSLITRSGPSYDVLTIKGKVWRVVDHVTKERIKLLDEHGDVLPAVRVHVIRANPNLSKVFYREGYEEGSDGAPDCFSNDGIAPDASVKNKESKSCAACPHNVWGSGKEGKGRACSDSRRIAVAPEGAPDKIMLLRVPAASLKNLSDFGANVDRKGVPYQMLVTRISFDPESASPKLVFKPVGYADEADVNKVAELQEDDVVKAIIGVSDDKAPVVEDDEPAPAPKAKAKPAPVVEEEEEAPAPKAKKAAPVVEEVEEEAPAPKAKKAKKAAPVVEEEEEEAPAPKKKATVLSGDLDDMLDGLDLDDL